MQHQATLQTLTENLSDVYVAIVDRAGAVVVARTLAPVVAGTTDVHRVTLTIPDTLGSGREVWDSVVGGFSNLTSDPILFAPVASQSSVDNIAGYTDTVEGSLDAIAARLAAQAPGSGPVVVWPAIPASYEGWAVIAVNFSDFRIRQEGVTVRASLQGAAPFSIDGDAFEVDASVTAVSGAALTVGSTTYPATPGRAWFVLPTSATIRDATGALGVPWRFDSTGARDSRGHEAISNRLKVLTIGGSLWALLQTP